MEIQTFLLATKVTRRPGNRYDVEQAALHSLEFPPESSFPVRFSLPALMVLRRVVESDEAPISLLFDLVDEDGRSTGQPSRIRFQAVFPAGKRYVFFPTQIAFEFPCPGKYRLDITADEGLTGGVYSYGIDITQRREA
jgi:hypothetical protein